MAKRSAAMLNADLVNMPAPTAWACHPKWDAPASAPTVAQVADAVLDELTAEHQTAGSLGKELKDAQAYVANKRVVKHDDQSVEVYEDNDTAVRYTLTPAKDEVNNKTTITPS